MHSGVQVVRGPASIVDQVDPWLVAGMTHPGWLPATDFDGRAHHCDLICSSRKYRMERFGGAACPGRADPGDVYNQAGLGREYEYIYDWLC